MKNPKYAHKKTVNINNNFLDKIHASHTNTTRGRVENVGKVFINKTS